MANALSGSPVSYRRNALGDYRAQGNGRSPMSAVNALQALSMIPGVGDFIGPVADAAMYYDKPETRTPGNFALSTLGLLPFVPGMTVFHGSPHKFDAFDMSKIGTGEGAQAYGHGLYFAEKPAVAGDYRNRVSKMLTYASEEAPDFNYPTPSNAVEKLALRKLTEELENGASLKDARKWALESTERDWFGAEEIDKQAIMDFLGRADYGHLYTVDLPDEAIDRMLDWDKPLSEQPEVVKKAFNEWVRPHLSTRQIGPELVDVNIGGGTIGSFPPSKVADVLADPSKYVPTTGKDFYRLVGGDTYGRNVLGPEQRSRMLNALGIPGIKYLDQGSRASGNGTRNFVVFDDKLAKILKRE